MEQKIKFPFVKFEATKVDGPTGQSYKTEFVLDVSSAANARPDVVDIYRAKGWPVIGHGNLDPAVHQDLIKHIRLAEMDEARIREEIKKEMEAEGKKKKPE